MVITHHAPSGRKASASPTPDPFLDAAYVNAWEDMLGKPDLWVYGHLHAAFDQGINGTRLVSNPLGYSGEQTGFYPGMVVEI